MNKPVNRYSPDYATEQFHHRFLGMKLDPLGSYVNHYDYKALEDLVTVLEEKLKKYE